MNRELYTAASGMVFESTRLEIAANNLANVGSDGFRAQRAFATAYAAAGAGGPSTVAAAGTYDEPGPGPLRPTGRPLDFALLDDALITVQTPDGPRYTRSGNLQTDAGGQLVDRNGYAVLDAAGNPIDGLTEAARIEGDGNIRDGAATVGRLALVRDIDGLLQRQGDGLLSAVGQDARLQQVADPRLRPGWLEGSGSSPISELVHLIETQRSFERYQRLLSLTMNEVNRRAVLDIAGN